MTASKTRSNKPKLPVVQLDNTSDSDSGDPRFESAQVDQKRAGYNNLFFFCGSARTARADSRADVR